MIRPGESRRALRGSAGIKELRQRRVWVTPWLIAANVAVFVGWVMLPRPIAETCQGVLALSARGLAAGRWWELASHAFLHATWWHLAINMGGLWVAGRPVERILGPVRFLVLYAVCVGLGGLVQLGLGEPGSLLLGASGGIFGVVISLCTMVPNATLVLLPFFGRWVRVRAKHLGWGLVASTAAFLVLGLEKSIGHPAHLGGAVAGYALTRWFGFGHPMRGGRGPQRGGPGPAGGR